MIPHPKKTTFQLILYFLKLYPARSAAVIGALLLAGFIEIIGIGALLPLLNVVLEKESAEPNTLSLMITQFLALLHIEPSFGNLLMIIVVTISAKSFINFHAMRLVAYSAADITNDLRVNLIKSLMSARWEYYSKLPIGKSANAVATEAETAGNFFTLVGKTISSLFQTVLYAGLAFLVDWKISLAAVIIGCVAAYLLKSLIRMARKSGEYFTNSMKTLLGRLNESLSGAKPLKAMGEEDRFTDLLQTDTQHINKARKRQSTALLALNSTHEPMMVILIAIGLFFAYSYANYPITELLLMAFLFQRLIGHANTSQSHYQNTVVYESAVHSILNATTTAQENVEQMNGAATPHFTKEITFKNVTLAYGDNVICDNLNDVIPAKKMSVVFGPSGIGKSTLLDAVLGLIQPQKGNISIDGTDLATLDIKKWRHMIGYVPQETFLFHDTIAANITLGNEDITEDEIIAALKASNAWEFIKDLDDGIHHIVGERGGKLSGGQKQRIALARALVKSPTLLILDEATSGLDKASEKIILDTLQKMASKVTIIAISHDPKILDIADHAIRLDKDA